MLEDDPDCHNTSTELNKSDLPDILNCESNNSSCSNVSNFSNSDKNSSVNLDTSDNSSVNLDISDNNSSVYLDTGDNNSCVNLDTSDNSSVNLDTSVGFGDEITHYYSNDLYQTSIKENNEGQVLLDLETKINYKNEEKDTLNSKRKEICDIENNDNVDQKTKQIHLTDDSIISEELSVNFNSNKCDINLKTCDNVCYDNKDVTENNVNSTNKQHQKSKINLDECDWESMFDDQGNCLEPSLLNEVNILLIYF